MAGSVPYQDPDLQGPMPWEELSGLGVLGPAQH